MRWEWLAGAGLLALGLGTATNAILGPLVLGQIRFHVSEGAKAQLTGGEIVSLGVVAPLALAAGALWLRRHWLGPLLALGPALYVLYLNVQFIAGPEYLRYPGNSEQFVPLFLILVIVGWAVALRAWRAIEAATLVAPSAGLRRVLAGVLIALAAIFALAWLGSIGQVLAGATVPQAYRDDPTLFWLVRLMDLGFVIPAALVTGVGLLRRSGWATKLSYAVSAFLALEVGSVAGMSVILSARGDPSADPVLLAGSAVGTVALAVAHVWLLLQAARARAGRAEGELSVAAIDGRPVDPGERGERRGR